MNFSLPQFDHLPNAEMPNTQRINRLPLRIATPGALAGALLT